MVIQEILALKATLSIRVSRKSSLRFNLKVNGAKIHPHKVDEDLGCKE
jgi:hypothetical protein